MFEDDQTTVSLKLLHRFLKIVLERIKTLIINLTPCLEYVGRSKDRLHTEYVVFSHFRYLQQFHPSYIIIQSYHYRLVPFKYRTSRYNFVKKVNPQKFKLFEGEQRSVWSMCQIKT